MLICDGLFLFCLLDYCFWSLHFKFAERFIYIVYSVILGPSRSSMVHIHADAYTTYTISINRFRCPSLHLIRIRLSISFGVYFCYWRGWRWRWRCCAVCMCVCVCVSFLSLVVSPSFVFVRLWQKCFNCFASKSLSFNFSLLFRSWQVSDLYICIYYANMWWGFCWSASVGPLVGWWWNSGIDGSHDGDRLSHSHCQAWPIRFAGFVSLSNGLSECWFRPKQKNVLLLWFVCNSNDVRRSFHCVLL